MSNGATGQGPNVGQRGRQCKIGYTPAVVPRPLGRVLLPLAAGILTVLAINPLTLEAWWFRQPLVTPSHALRVWGWDLVALAVAVVLAVVVSRVAPGDPETRRRRLAAGLLALSLGVLLSGLFIEAGLRLTGTRLAFPPSLRRELSWRAHRAAGSTGVRSGTNYAFSAALGWELRPNLRTGEITSNSEGLRGSREYAPDPGAGIRRVLCVGDSFTFGARLPDENTMPARLEAELNGGSAARWEVLNLGVEGYGTDQQWLNLSRKGFRYRPRVVVLGFMEENLERNLMSFRDYAKPYFTLKDERLVLHNVPVPSPEELLARAPRLPPVYLFSLVGTLSEEFRLTVSIGDLARTPAGRVTLALLDTIGDAVVSRGAVFVLTSIPRRVLPRASDTERLLASWAARTGTPFLNLRTAYLKLPEAERERLYRHHWSEYGAAVTARLLAEALRGAMPAPPAMADRKSTD